MTAEIYVASPIAPGAKQTQDVLDLLELLGPLTTSELKTFGVEHPPARIRDLRHKHGKNITMQKIMALSHDGRLHRIGQYTLVDEEVAND